MSKHLMIALCALAAALAGLYLKHDRDMLAGELAVSTAEISRLKAEAEASRLALVARDALDKKNFEEMTNAKNEIGVLRDQLTSGTKRVLVRATCPAAVPAAAGAASMDDARDAELTAAAGQDYLHLREQIVTTEAQLRGLKDYVRQVVQRAK